MTVLFGNGSRREFASAVRQTVPNQPDAEEFDLFGSALTATDFNGDGTDDLAIGTPFEHHERRFLPDRSSSGRVTVLYDSRSDGQLITTSRSDWHEDRGGVETGRDNFDSFGRTLSFGDLNDDRIADLLVGVPIEGQDAGIVHVLYGTGVGLSADRSLGGQLLVEGVGARTGDGFGAPLP